MPTATLEANHKLSCRLAAESVDTAHGILRAATVMKSGIQAAGKFVMLDAKGAITRDPEEMVSEVPVFTDEKTLSTLMAAAAAAGKRIKTRENHEDVIGARAGFADTIALTNDGRVVADIHLLKSYGNREIVLETAQETPEQIGLSIDFLPTFELRDGKAFMRVQELYAIDLVDQGAATPDGLFLSASVDTARKVESPAISTPATMAATSPTIDELMASIAKMTEGYTALAKQVADQGASLAKLTAPPKTDETKTDEALKAAKTDALKLSTEEIKTQVAAAIKEENLRLKKERALLRLGLTSDDQRVKLATASVEEIEKLADEKKDYLALVAARAESAKCKRSEAHVWVMKNHKDEYSAHLAANGVVKLTMAA